MIEIVKGRRLSVGLGNSLVIYQKPANKSQPSTAATSTITLATMVRSDVAVKSFEFGIATVYAPNIAACWVSFFSAVIVSRRSKTDSFSGWLECDLWSLEGVGSGIRGLGRCESSLIDLMARHDLVDRFCLDHPRRKICAWLDTSSSVRARSNLYKVFVRRADTNSVTCPTFHHVAWTDNRLVRVSLRLANGPSLAGYGKFNTSLLEIRDSRYQFESLVQLSRITLRIRTKNMGKLFKGGKTFQTHRNKLTIEIEVIIWRLLLSYRTIPHAGRQESPSTLTRRKIRVQLTMSYSTNEKV